MSDTLPTDQDQVVRAQGIIRELTEERNKLHWAIAEFLAGLGTYDRIAIAELESTITRKEVGTQS